MRACVCVCNLVEGDYTSVKVPCSKLVASKIKKIAEFNRCNHQSRLAQTHTYTLIYMRTPTYTQERNITLEESIPFSDK